MTKVVYKSLQTLNDAKASSMITKRMRAADGKLITIYTVDADSKTVSKDLTQGFKRNVRRVRTANNRILSLPESVSRKA